MIHFGLVFKKKILAPLVVAVGMILISNPEICWGFTNQVKLQIDDLTVTNFKTGRKVVSYFGNASGSQDIEYVPTVGTGTPGRFFTVKNGSAISCSKLENGQLKYESNFYFVDDRSGRIPESSDDLYPKTSFVHTSGCAYQEINQVPYLFIHESWGNSTPKYKEQILYKCRVDYENKLLRIEGAMVVADSISNWPVAADGTPYNKVQEISGGQIIGDWIYSCEWSYSTTDTPTCHVFVTNINDCTNPGKHRPTHRKYLNANANKLPFLNNQGIVCINQRWFLTRNPYGAGVYEVAIKEDATGAITKIELLGEIRGEKPMEEEGCTAFEGDLIYFYCEDPLYSAYRVSLTAKVRKELVEIPLDTFKGCQSDYDDLRVYCKAQEIPRVISNGKLKFLAENTGESNSYPEYLICYGDSKLTTPNYSGKELQEIESATLSGKINYQLELPGVKYFDDFSNEKTLANYEINDLGDVSAPSNWKIFENMLYQTSNIYGPTSSGTQFPYERGTHLILKGVYDEDWELVTDFKAEDNDGLGLVFGYQDRENFYWVEWDRQTAKLGFCKSVGQRDNGTVIAQVTNFPYLEGVWYNLKIKKQASRYQIYVNDQLILKAQDSTFNTGRVGLLSRGMSGIRYDNFAITPSIGSHLKIYSKDEGYAEQNIIKPRIYLQNIGKETIANFDLYYYFTAEAGKIPVVDAYYTPGCTTTLLDLKNGNYCVRYRFVGINLKPGQYYPDQLGNVVGIHYTDWSKLNKTDDYSNPGSESWNETSRIQSYFWNDETEMNELPVLP